MQDLVEVFTSPRLEDSLSEDHTCGSCGAAVGVMDDGCTNCAGVILDSAPDSVGLFPTSAEGRYLI